MNKEFSMYTTDYISGVMSLRNPQRKSLEILDNILSNLELSKDMDLKDALSKVNSLYPTCSDFERNFMSLAFVLATGVGKTRLMGTFITYLYTNYGIKNYFVVAPGNTVYEKLKQDLGDPSNSKYVFKGIGCFNNPPQIITDDDYKTMNISLFESEVKIYIYNIDKFNKENVNMKKINEFLGDSFFNKLSNLDDLIVIMDEAHHYHADKGGTALNDLNPLFGIELTATPYYNKGSKQIKFKNAVYEYPLSESIREGYTRTPYAVTQRDIHFFNFGDDEDELDKLMIQDGITCHERIKAHLETYSENTGKHFVKPFMMVVCKNTNHANDIYNYITSKSFMKGKYRNKTLIIHSNQSKVKREVNVRTLLEVESPDNPIEIVIHVDMLKEGWDVNNLYTIVPLRTAASKVLREQMVGRGLRLPYGERVGEREIDSVMLTAHDKFDELLKEAQKGDSIFKVGCVIDVEDLKGEEKTTSQISLEFPNKEIDEDVKRTGLNENSETRRFIKDTNELIKSEVSKGLIEKNSESSIDINKVIQNVENSLSNNKDLAEIYEENKELPLEKWLKNKTEEIVNRTINKFIPIPQIQITDKGITEYKFVNFDLDVKELNHVPIENELLIQNLENTADSVVIKGHSIDFKAYAPRKVILQILREKPEIDYEKCSRLLNKLIDQVLSYYENKYGENGMKNIVMMNKLDIGNKIYRQMLKEDHFYYSQGFIEEKIVDLNRKNYATTYNFSEKVSFFEGYNKPIRQVLFTDIEKGVFDRAKFDSEPELTFARVIERDKNVKNWLRPSATQFNLYYNNGKRYVPDFVVETEEKIYLVEVKGEDRVNDPNVIAKGERARQYCKISSEWGKANGYKEWRYLFIPATQITLNSSFMNLAKKFGDGTIHETEGK